MDLWTPWKTPWKTHGPVERRFAGCDEAMVALVQCDGASFQTHICAWIAINVTEGFLRRTCQYDLMVVMDVSPQGGGVKYDVFVEQ
jgi:hypothetical protein